MVWRESRRIEAERALLKILCYYKGVRARSLAKRESGVHRRTMTTKEEEERRPSRRTLPWLEKQIRGWAGALTVKTPYLQGINDMEIGAYWKTYKSGGAAARMTLLEEQLWPSVKVTTQGGVWHLFHCFQSVASDHGGGWRIRSSKAFKRLIKISLTLFCWNRSEVIHLRCPRRVLGGGQLAQRIVSWFYYRLSSQLIQILSEFP